MLKYVAINLYAPCYVLIVHYSYFLKVLKKHAGKDLAKFVKEAESLAFIGGVLDDTVNLDLSEPTRPELVKVNGKFLIKQLDKALYFSSTSNLIMEWAVVFVSYEGKTVPVLVRLKR